MDQNIGTMRNLAEQSQQSPALSPIIVFIIPALPCTVDFIYNRIPSSRPYISYYRTKMIYMPDIMLDVSHGGAFLFLLHFILMILVGTAAYASEHAQGKSHWRSTSVSSGQVALMNYFLVVIPSSKISFTFPHSSDTSISYTRTIRYHQVIGFLAIITSLIHLSANTMENNNILFSMSNVSDVVPVYGFVAFIMTCMMAWTAIEPFRRLQYEIFQRVHHLSIFVVIFIILHVPSAVGFIPGIVMHGIDTIHKIYSYYSSKKLAMLTCSKGSYNDIITMRVPIDRYGAGAPGLGSFYYLHIPDISLTEWHPFSVSSYDEPSYTVVFSIKAMGQGSFTKRLYDFAEKVSSSESESLSLHSHRVAILGPYGNLSINLQSYRHIILIAGGIGVTPMWMILDDVIRYINADRHAAASNTVDEQPLVSSNISLTASWFRKRAYQPAMYPQLSRITLIWTYRGDELKRLFTHKIPTDSTFPDHQRSGVSLTAARQDISIEYRFFDSTAKPGSINDDSTTAIYRTDNAFVTSIVAQDYERPNIPDLVRSYEEQRFGKTCIVACGPHGLVTSARAVAKDRGIDTHIEHFEL